MTHISTADLAREVRKLSIEMVYRAKASHIGGALSMADILAVLYNDVLRINPTTPEDNSRDRFLLSKGHACTSLYSVLAMKGFFPVESLKEYGTNATLFTSHTNHYLAGIEISAGSLGHALPVALGLALAANRKKESWNSYCLVSDGELDEGSNWEAILLAPQLKLGNLVLIVDYNKIQSLGAVVDVIDLHPLKEKFDAFRWESYEVDGHNIEELQELFKQMDHSNGIPKVMIAHTIKGKGVDFMENKVLWHYKSPSQEEYTNAITQLNKQ